MKMPLSAGSQSVNASRVIGVHSKADAAYEHDLRYIL
jgi:hypothetical protein